MSRRRHARREGAGIEANLTSLIDVTFLLIVFFVLVSRLNEIESVDLDLPAPQGAASMALEAQSQIVISVLPVAGKPGEAGSYRLGVDDYAAGSEGLAGIEARLAGLYRANPNLDINIRADRSIHYQHIEPLLSAVGAAARSAPGLPASGARINLAVLKDQR